MGQMVSASLYFGLFISVGAYLFGVWLKKKTKLSVLNPLLVSVICVIAVLLVFDIEYGEYEKGARYLGYFLTPATVCLAIPLYKQLSLLKNHAKAVFCGIASGVFSSAATIFVMSKMFGFTNQQYVTLLPKSITTAIGMGVSEEAGGIVTLTVVSIIITGIFGNMIAELLFKIVKISHPISKGLALGTGAHAVGTAKALEMGEIEGAMSSLAIAVAGLMTVVVVPIISGLI